MSLVAQFEQAFAAQTGINPERWHTVLSRMEADGGRARLTAAKLDLLVARIKTPKALSGIFETMLRLHRDDGRLKDGLALIKQNAEEGIFSLQDWGEALETLRQWLLLREKSALAVEQIQYIACAAESSEAQVGTGLKATVESFLDTWGMEAAKG